MKKLTKTQVRKQLGKNMNQTVYLFPSNCGPANTTWVKGAEYNPIRYAISYKELDTHFNRFINEFQYYNCNKELGYRVHFYMEVESK